MAGAGPAGIGLGGALAHAPVGVTTVSADAALKDSLARDRYLREMHLTSVMFNPNIPYDHRVASYSGQLVPNQSLLEVKQDDLLVLRQTTEQPPNMFDETILLGTALAVVVVGVLGDIVSFRRVCYLGPEGVPLDTVRYLETPTRVDLRRGALVGYCLKIDGGGYLGMKILGEYRAKELRAVPASHQGKHMSTLDGYVVSIPSNNSRTTENLRAATFISRVASPINQRIMSVNQALATVNYVAYHKDMLEQLEAEVKGQAMTRHFSPDVLRLYRELVAHNRVGTSITVSNFLSERTLPTLKYFGNNWKDEERMESSKYTVDQALMLLQNWLTVFVGEQWQSVLEPVRTMVNNPGALWSANHWYLSYFREVFDTIVRQYLVALATWPAESFGAFLNPPGIVSFDNPNVAPRILSAAFASESFRPKSESNLAHALSAHISGSKRVLGSTGSRLSSEGSQSHHSSDSSTKSSNRIENKKKGKRVKGKHVKNGGNKSVSFSDQNMCYRQLLYNIGAKGADGGRSKACEQVGCKFSHKSPPAGLEEKRSLVKSVFGTNKSNRGFLKSAMAALTVS